MCFLPPDLMNVGDKGFRGNSVKEIPFCLNARETKRNKGPCHFTFIYELYDCSHCRYQHFFKCGSSTRGAVFVSAPVHLVAAQKNQKYRIDLSCWVLI